jgi:sphingolipid 4-desaturase/C4-monooxygenase
MPSSTSILMTATAKPEKTAPRLRVADQDKPLKPSTAKEGNEHDIFFWTYTEEPHRTRRQAIIKVHPDVGRLICFINGHS